MLLGLWCYTFTFTGSLRGLSHSKALIVNLCGSSVSNLLPGGGAVGLAATYAICRSWGFSRRGDVDLGHRHRGLERDGPHRAAGHRDRRAVVRRGDPAPAP